MLAELVEPESLAGGGDVVLDVGHLLVQLARLDHELLDEGGVDAPYDDGRDQPDTQRADQQLPGTDPEVGYQQYGSSSRYYSQDVLGGQLGVDIGVARSVGDGA